MRNFSKLQASKVVVSILLASSIASIFYHVHYWLNYGRWMKTGVYWDMSVYEKAVLDLNLHLNPYTLDAGLPFIYHPNVLYAFAEINKLVPLRLFLIAAYVISAVFFLVQLREALAEDSRTKMDESIQLVGILILACLSITGAVIVSAFTGNVAPCLHLAILGTAILYVRKKENSIAISLVILIGIASLIKPYLLTYMGLYFVLFDKRNRNYAALVSLVIFLAIWFAGALHWPVEYSNFRTDLATILLGDDFGFSVYGVLSSQTHADRFALIVHCLVMAIFLFFSIFYAPKIYGFSDNELIKTLFLIPFLVIANPRMKEYDFFVAVLCGLLFVYVTARNYFKPILLCGFVVSGVPIFGWLLEREGFVLPKLITAHDLWQIASLLLMIFLCLLAIDRKASAEPLVLADESRGIQQLRP